MDKYLKATNVPAANLSNLDSSNKPPHQLIENHTQLLDRALKKITLYTSICNDYKENILTLKGTIEGLENSNNFEGREKRIKELKSLLNNKEVEFHDFKKQEIDKLQTLVTEVYEQNVKTIKNFNLNTIDNKAFNELDKHYNQVMKLNKSTPERKFGLICLFIAVSILTLGIGTSLLVLNYKSKFNFNNKNKEALLKNNLETKKKAYSETIDNLTTVNGKLETFIKEASKINFFSEPILKQLNEYKQEISTNITSIKQRINQVDNKINNLPNEIKNYDQGKFTKKIKKESKKNIVRTK